jgi:hypothetical protein
MLQALVDADNVAPARVQPVLDLLDGRAEVSIVASGRPEALALLRWPATAELLPHQGWQRADVALAEAYRPGAGPLLLITGDGDFGLLAQRHGGPVLVVSGAPSGRLRDAGLVVDPAVDGLAPIVAWLAAVRA